MNDNELAKIKTDAEEVTNELTASPAIDNPAEFTNEAELLKDIRKNETAIADELAALTQELVEKLAAIKENRTSTLRALAKARKISKARLENFVERKLAEREAAVEAAGKTGDVDALAKAVAINAPEIPGITIGVRTKVSISDLSAIPDAFKVVLADEKALLVELKRGTEVAGAKLAPRVIVGVKKEKITK